MDIMKQRLKIYLTKHNKENLLTASDLIKYEEGETNYPQTLSLEDIYTTTLYYKDRLNRVPKWYSDFLNQTDSAIQVSYAEGLFLRKVEYRDDEFLFVISFGNAGNWIVREHLVSRFGLIIAL